MNELNVARRAVELAMKRGWGAEAFYQEIEEQRVEVHRGNPENQLHAVGRGLGLRVERGGRLGSASTTHLDRAGVRQGLERVVAGAIAAAEIAGAREASTFAELPSQPYPDLKLRDPALTTLSEDARWELARQAESEAFAADPRIRKSETAGFGDVLERVALVNSNGLAAFEERTVASLWASVVAVQDREERSGFHVVQARGPAGLDPHEVGKRAAQKATSLLGSRKVGTARVPVILDPEVGCALLGLLAQPLSAEACLVGSSMLADKLDRRVGSSVLCLDDDPFHPDGVGGGAFDAEGTPSQRKPILQDGILRTHLHNSYTARRKGLASTGNAARAGYADDVGIAPSNLVLRPGRRSQRELESALDRGFVVQEVMGLHMANTVSGDFSFGMVGHLVENGRRICPVEEMTLAGNLLELLSHVVELGNDLSFEGDVASPSIVVDGLTVSGQ